MLLNKLKVAIVTGGTAGIGFAVARELLERGYSVFICGRQLERLNSAILSLKSEYGNQRIAGSICDVRSLADVKEMVEKVVNHYGRIDILINNAGVAHIASFEEIEPHQWADIIDTNLTGVYNCCHATLPWLKKGGGDIVNIGSRSGRYSFRGGSVYNATKFGLQGFTEALFLDLHQYDIRVSLIAPGTVATGLGGTKAEDWHIMPKDVAILVGDVIEADKRVAINWVEIRPARPQ